MTKSERKEFAKAIALLRDIRAQNFVVDAAFDDADTRRWIRKADALLDRNEPKGGYK